MYRMVCHMAHHLVYKIWTAFRLCWVHVRIMRKTCFGNFGASIGRASSVDVWGIVEACLGDALNMIGP